MVMKKTIILFACMLVALTCFSKVTDSRDIALHAGHENEEALRSILPVRAVIDGNILQLEFLDSPENVVVKISDKAGKEIITSAYSFPQLVKLYVNQGANDYTIEIIYGETCLYGDFTIENM